MSEQDQDAPVDLDRHDDEEMPREGFVSPLDGPVRVERQDDDQPAPPEGEGA